MIHLRQAITRLIHYKGPRPLKVIIVGSPRAGTSFLASLVHRMGFSLGPTTWLKKPDDHNPLGYFECLPLLNISYRVLERFGADFHGNLPCLEPGWTKALEVEQREIVTFVEIGGIELYKDNRLLVLADLYYELFPEAKWIFIHRSLRATYESRFGRELSFKEWETLTNRRLDAWNASRPSREALYVSYEDFESNIMDAVLKIQAYLEVELSASGLRRCVDTYMPRRS